jgi:hypothetical protein
VASGSFDEADGTAEIVERRGFRLAALGERDNSFRLFG